MEQVDGTPILMLAEIQKLEKRISEIETRLVTQS